MIAISTCSCGIGEPRLVAVIVRQLQHHQLADVVQQAAEERFILVDAGFLGDEPRDVGRADRVIGAFTRRIAVDARIVHPRRERDGDDDVAHRGRAEAHDRFEHRGDRLHGGAIGGVGETEHAGGEDLILRDERGDRRDADLGIADQLDDAVRDAGIIGMTVSSAFLSHS